MPCCGCLASATPSTCAARLWKTSSSQARRPERPRALPRLSWCSTTPMASCRSTSTRFPSRDACIEAVKASISSTAAWRAAWTCSTSCTIPVWAPARIRSSARAAWTPSCNPSPRTAARSSRRPPACSSTSSARRKASASWPPWMPRSRACAMWRARWAASSDRSSARRRRPALTKSSPGSLPTSAWRWPWTTCVACVKAGMRLAPASISWWKTFRPVIRTFPLRKPPPRRCRSRSASKLRMQATCRAAISVRRRQWSASTAPCYCCMRSAAAHRASRPMCA